MSALDCLIRAEFPQAPVRGVHAHRRARDNHPRAPRLLRGVNLNPTLCLGSHPPLCLKPSSQTLLLVSARTPPSRTPPCSAYSRCRVYGFLDIFLNPQPGATSRRSRSSTRETRGATRPRGPRGRRSSRSPSWWGCRTTSRRLNPQPSTLNPQP